MESARAIETGGTNGTGVVDGLPPGPKMPRMVNGLRWTFTPTTYVRKCAERYGEIFTLRFPPPARNAVHVFTPEAVKQVFTASPDVLHAGETNAIQLASLMGENSLLTMDGPRRLRERKLMLPSFHGERMTQYGALMAETAQTSIAGWPIGEPFELQPRFRAITLDIILRAVFGVDEGPRLAAMRGAVVALMQTADHWAAAIPLLRHRIPGWAPWKRFKVALEKTDALLYAEITRRRDQVARGDRIDVMSMLIEAEYEDGEKMTDVEIRDELITLLAAGHETTATALSWTFDLLFRSPESLAKLEREVATEGGTGEYMDAVAKESLRIRPVVPAVARRVKQPFELCGYRLPAGTAVVADIYLAHHNPATYPEPERFLPERFLEQPAGTYTWIPFGGSVRRCLGASFAIFEMKIVLTEVLEHVRLSSATGAAEEMVRRHVTLRPKCGTVAVVDGLRPSGDIHSEAMAAAT